MLATNGNSLYRPAMKVVAGTALLLLIPLVAMQFTSEVNWTPGDFVAAAVLLAGTGLAYVFGASRLRSSRSRLILGAVLGAALLIVWAELAVGIFS